ncbi:MAG: alpha-L-fucosidase [Sphingobacterium sp.]|jgi:alpha-L-fucosidase|nr:alpha-L-fucosidase [Sphingobacterium sp.]
MKKILLFTIFLVSIVCSQAQKRSITGETAEQKMSRLGWWTDARFGMFIHWGLYAMPARHEWVKNRERLSDDYYQRYFDHFNPDEYNPKEWAKKAKAAGMKYVVLTTKHHEGFCLFDSQYTTYKSTKTGAKRDLVKEFVDAFRAEGLKIGFYYSLIDWHHPDFTIDMHHPLRFKGNAEKETQTAVAYYTEVNRGKDMHRYQDYLKNQVTELLTRYGKIDILWLDYSYPGQFGKGNEDWNAIPLLKHIKKLQPEILINDRLDLRQYSDGGDFETPEQVSPDQLLKYRGKYWETCQTFSGSWGYFRDEDRHPWKSQRELLDLLITSVANGGNLILNVGPTARGKFDYRANNALDSIGYWMDANNRSIYHCTYAPETYKIPEELNIKQTYNPKTKTLYLHLFKYPIDGKLLLPGFAEKIKYAQLLNDASEIEQKAENDGLILKIPKQKPLYDIPVIELFLK